MKQYIKENAISFKTKEELLPNDKVIVFDPIYKGNYVTFKVSDKRDVPNIAIHINRANNYNSLYEMFQSLRVKK